MAQRGTTSTSISATPSTPTAASPGPPARTAAEKWAKYKLGLALPALRTLRASTGLYSHWDDHEFVNDFSRSEHGAAIYARRCQGVPRLLAGRVQARLGLYRSVRWGKHLELFFLDERSFRSGKATSACGNDLAPTAPQPVRDAFASLAPGLRNPVPPGVPGGDQRPRSHHARRTSVRRRSRARSRPRPRPGRSS